MPPVENTTGKKRGRRPPPANLPREHVEYDLPDDQKACPCCRGQMHRMGEAVTEQLHIEVKAKVLQNVRFKYACRHCDRTGINAPVVTAPMPTQPLPGSVATASTLAFALVHKYVDGTPLYRLAQAFERAGVPISRGALGCWVIGSSEKHLSRIYEALKLRLRSQPLIHSDETTVQVLKEKDKKATSASYMWAYRSGKGSHEPIVLLDYQPGRGQIHPQAFLGDYRGIVMSDGYTAWRTLERATHIGCMPTPGGALSMPSGRGRRAAVRPSRRCGSSTSSTGLKGRRGTEYRRSVKHRPTAFAASASNIVSPSSMLSRYDSMPRGNQGDSGASIRMRELRRARDAGRGRSPTGVTSPADRNRPHAGGGLEHWHHF